ncbi:1-acyl-sn-glycerol-3-phosphate acyltransferase [Desulfobacteraceae bacterium SEEP-SAG9]|nr:1-acyl-sn-glycerol-3-phosphate acyltransferase [Desulfobacteraceae bacterium SEEP-SAG9]
MNRFLRFIFYQIVVRLVVLIVLGLNVRHRDRLPKTGPAILVANHNSHLDTLVLITLLSSRLLNRIKPVAAADYFLSSPLKAWFALNIVGILPIKRQKDTPDEDLLAPCYLSLEEGDILVFFPEGSRGKPENLTAFKGGIAKLAKRYPAVPITPVLLHGLGKVLPKGEKLLVPFFCDVFVGEPLYGLKDRKGFMAQLEERMAELSQEGAFPPWE